MQPWAKIGFYVAIVAALVTIALQINQVGDSIDNLTRVVQQAHAK